MNTVIKYILLALILLGLGYGAYYYQNKAQAPAGATLPSAGQTKLMQWSESPKMAINLNKTYTATMVTTDGTMKIELFAKENPITVNNFVFLAQQGFYNGTKFHRIIRNFMIQGGDPLGTGMGGPGYKFNDEPITRNYDRGTLAMANAGPNTNGSQFFIMTQNTPLQKNYVIFGKLTDGFDTLDKIAATPVTASPSGEVSMPTEDVLINSITIEEK